MSTTEWQPIRSVDVVYQMHRQRCSVCGVDVTIVDDKPVACGCGAEYRIATSIEARGLPDPIVLEMKPAVMFGRAPMGEER